MQLGPYQMVDEVGRGGCGTVYRGRSPDGRDVAIKVLTSTNPAAAARFDRERALLAELGEAEGFVPLLGSARRPGPPTSSCRSSAEGRCATSCATGRSRSTRPCGSRAGLGRYARPRPLPRAPRSDPRARGASGARRRELGVEGQEALLRANAPGVALETVTTKPGRRNALAALPGAAATVVIGDVSGTLRWLDLELGREVRAVKAHDESVLCVAVSPDGRLGASGSFDHTVRLWDAQTGAALETIVLKESDDVVTALAFTKDGRLVAGCGSGTVVRLSVR